MARRIDDVHPGAEHSDGAAGVFVAGGVERAPVRGGVDADGAAGDDVEPEAGQAPAQLFGELHAATAGGARTDDGDRPPAGTPGAGDPQRGRRTLDEGQRTRILRIPAI